MDAWQAFKMQDQTPFIQRNNEGISITIDLRELMAVIVWSTEPTVREYQATTWPLSEPLFNKFVRSHLNKFLWFSFRMFTWVLLLFSCSNGSRIAQLSHDSSG